jgi:hypothetical protein
VLAQRLTREHASRRIDLVCAPVFGTPADAAAGRLWVVAAGADPVPSSKPFPAASPSPATSPSRPLSSSSIPVPRPRQSRSLPPETHFDAAENPSRPPRIQLEFRPLDFLGNYSKASVRQGTV